MTKCTLHVYVDIVGLKTPTVASSMPRTYHTVCPLDKHNTTTTESTEAREVL